VTVASTTCVRAIQKCSAPIQSLPKGELLVDEVVQVAFRYPVRSGGVGEHACLAAVTERDRYGPLLFGHRLGIFRHVSREPFDLAARPDHHRFQVSDKLLVDGRVFGPENIEGSCATSIQDSKHDDVLVRVSGHSFSAVPSRLFLELD
jgi:hypothetical protein